MGRPCRGKKEEKKPSSDECDHAVFSLFSFIDVDSGRLAGWLNNGWSVVRLFVSLFVCLSMVGCA